MNGAGRSEFTVDFRIATAEAFFTHVDAVFHADIAGFSDRVIHTAPQLFFLSQLFHIRALSLVGFRCTPKPRPNQND
jgi:hypothetical protein